MSTNDEKTIDTLEADELPIVAVDAEVAFPALGVVPDTPTHEGLIDRNDPDQHQIEAITGLRYELDEIGRLKAIEYASYKQTADYYMWHENTTQRRVGLFVTLEKDTNKIKVCDGNSDVFGVTVDAAGFVGGQEYTTADDGTKVGKDEGYALVATYGLVGVLRTHNVGVGDYVVPDRFGFAKKSSGDYGYLVTAISSVNGYEYAAISLAAPLTLANKIADSVQDLSGRMSKAEYNIVSVTNVANSAYVVAKDARDKAEKNAEYTTEQILNALGRLDGAEDALENMSQSVTNALTDAAIARVRADGAVSAAETIRRDAVAKANEALLDIQATKKELKQTTIEMSESIDTVYGEAQKIASELEEFKSEFSELAAYQKVNDDGTTTEGLAGFMAQVDENVSELAQIASWQNGVDKSISTISQTANQQGASIDALVKKDDELNKAIAGVSATANANKSTVEILTEWRSDIKEDIESISNIKNTADANSAKIEQFTAWQGKVNEATATLKTQADANGAKIEALVSNLDKYAVGEYSQIYGLTLKQAKEILAIGAVYIPSRQHEELYDADEDYKQEFSKGYSYTWNGKKWDVSLSTVATFSKAYVDGNDNCAYWVVEEADVVHEDVTYDLGGLYLWQENDWVKVASAADNLFSRAVSSVRQTVNEISAEVVNVKGDMAGLSAKLDETGARASMVASVVTEKNDIEPVGPYATAENLPKPGEPNTYYCVGASAPYDVYTWDGEKFVKDTLMYYDGANFCKVNTARIVNAVNNDGESSVSINADKINFEGYATFLGTDGNGTITEIDGGIIKTDTITADHITVDTLSAISADVGELTAGTIQSGNYVTGESGLKLDLTNGTADITGKITAKEGSIGVLTINNRDSSKPENEDISLGTDHFKVYADGTVCMDGTINATAGVIGNCEINEDGELIVPAANITNKLTADQIEVGSLTVDAAQITGTLDANEIDVINLDANKITTGVLDTDLLVIDELSALSLDLGTVRAGALQSNNYRASGIAIWEDSFEVGTIQSEGLKYQLNTDAEGNKTYSVIGIGDCKDTKIIIPAMHKDEESGEYFDVTEIVENAFYYCIKITSVQVGSNVKSIGSGVFAGCSSLESITLPFVGSGSEAAVEGEQHPLGYIFGTEEYPKSYSVSSRQDYANKLTYYIPNSLKSVKILSDYIPDGALYKCKNVENVEFQAKGVGQNDDEYIGSYAFSGCSNLTNISILGYIKSIGEDAFSGCKKLKKVNIDNINDWLKIEFADIDANPLTYAHNLYVKGELLRTLHIPSKDPLNAEISKNDITKINKYAFYQCTSLTKVTFDEKVNIPLITIEDQAFYYCYNLTNVDIPQNVTSIGSNAFYNCLSLVEVYNKSSLTITEGTSSNGYIGYYAKAVYTEPHTSKVSINDSGYIIYTDGDVADLIGYTGDEKELILPPCDKINSWAFYSRANLTSVVIPARYNTIGQNAFRDCYNLREIIFSGDSLLENIEQQSLRGCTNLLSIVIPSGVTNIADRAFEGCHKLVEVHNKSTLEISIDSEANGYVGYYAKNIYQDAYDSKVSTNFDGYIIYTDEDYVGFLGYIGDKIDIIIPDNVTEIYSHAFYKNNSVKHIIFGKDSKLSKIGEYAFSDCENLTSIVIPSTTQTLGNNAFTNCSNIKSIYYGGDKANWSDSYISETKNDNLRKSTVNKYFYSANRPLNGSNRWYYNDQEGFQMSCESDYMIESPYFKVTQDGRMMANSVDLDGHILATSGKVGNVSIDKDGAIVSANGNFKVDADGNIVAQNASFKECTFDGHIDAASGTIGGLTINSQGIRGNTEDGMVSLTTDGVRITGEGAKFEVGNFSVADENGDTVWQINGPFHLNAANATSIGLMSDDGDVVRDVTLNLLGTSVGSSSGAKFAVMFAVDGSSAEILYPLTLSVDYEAYASNFLETEPNTNKLLSSGTMSFRLDSNSTSDTQSIYLNSSYPYWRFKKQDGNWSGYYSYKNFSQYYNKVIDTTTIRQTAKKNNIKIKGNLVSHIETGGNTYNLGTSDAKWHTVYATTGTIQTSDENKKKNIQPLSEQYGQIFDALQPISFQFNENNSDRTHIGFGARAVKTAVEQVGLTTKDFAGYCEWQEKDGNVGCGLRYEEFIAMCVDQIQKLKKRVDELEEKLATQQND